MFSTCWLSELRLRTKLTLICVITSSKNVEHLKRGLSLQGNLWVKTELKWKKETYLYQNFTRTKEAANWSPHKLNFRCSDLYWWIYGRANFRNINAGTAKQKLSEITVRSYPQIFFLFGPHKTQRASLTHPSRQAAHTQPGREPLDAVSYITTASLSLYTSQEGKRRVCSVDFTPRAEVLTLLQSQMWFRKCFI